MNTMKLITSRLLIIIFNASKCTQLPQLHPRTRKGNVPSTTNLEVFRDTLRVTAVGVHAVHLALIAMALENPRAEEIRSTIRGTAGKNAALFLELVNLFDGLHQRDGFA